MKEEKARKTLTQELTKFCEDNGIEKGKVGYLLGLHEKHKAIEYANQQPEVDHVKDFHTWRLPHEKQPEQDKVREAAEKVVETNKAKPFRISDIDEAIGELEKALNQNK